MRDFLRGYFEQAARCVAGVQAGGDFVSELAAAYAALRESARAGGKAMVIGNGGSAAIAGHTAVDLWKNGRIPAVCFNDPSQLTCLSNDLGYEEVFAEPVRMFARPGDVLVAISSSGRSRNILNAVAAARSKGCRVITLSGFKPDNPLRGLGDWNFYADSIAYGFVETAHSAVCHALVDCAIRDS
jgi:D-sedoheptulose 7-phosphate isomerase